MIDLTKKPQMYTITEAIEYLNTKVEDMVSSFFYDECETKQVDTLRVLLECVHEGNPQASERIGPVLSEMSEDLKDSLDNELFFLIKSLTETA